MDRSFELEAEVGDDTEAYKEGDRLAEELLDREDIFEDYDGYEDDDLCIACEEPLDRYGNCPNCDAIEFDEHDDDEDYN